MGVCLAKHASPCQQGHKGPKQKAGHQAPYGNAVPDRFSGGICLPVSPRSQP
jgi:hypothetical protein